jgi:hypothetical protein
MVFMIVMFFVLIALFVMMLGLVKLSENVIGTPQLVPLGDSASNKTIDNTESL